MMYKKPEIIIIQMESTNMMVTSCTCHGHCSCATNENPHSVLNKCKCSNRPSNIEFDEDI